METNNTDTRKEAIEWWSKLNTITEKVAILNRFGFDQKRTTASLTGREIEAIYKAEHPSPTAAIEGIKEEGKGWTKGEWRKDGKFITANFNDGNGGTAWLDIIECKVLPSNCMSGTKEAEANAQRIVMAVNGWDGLHEFVTRLASIKLPNGTVNGDYINTISNEAKELLNNLKP